MTTNLDRLSSFNFSVDALLFRVRTQDEEERLQVSSGKPDPLARRGDEATLAEFVVTAENCRTELVRLAARVLGSSEDADDVVQDALLAAFVDILESRAESNLKDWLIELVVEAALEASSSRVEGLFESFEAISVEEIRECPLREINPGMDVERHYELKEMGELVCTILESMSDARQQVFEMCVLERHPLRQTAAFLDMSPSNVKALIFRTKRTLRREISKHSNRGTKRVIVNDRCSQSPWGVKPTAPAHPGDYQKWSMGIIEDRLARGRRFQVLNVVDQHTRECLTLHVSTALSGEKIVAALDQVMAACGVPESITVNSETEFTTKAVGRWSNLDRIHPGLIRPGGPVENGSMETFKRKLRDECLNVNVFFSVAEVRRKLEVWRRNYNRYGRDTASQNRTRKMSPSVAATAAV